MEVKSTGDAIISIHNVGEKQGGEAMEEEEPWRRSTQITPVRRR